MPMPGAAMFGHEQMQAVIEAINQPADEVNNPVWDWAPPAKDEALASRVAQLAESDLNDVRVIQPRSVGGLQMDAQWLDEFHHSLVSFLTGARSGFLDGFGTLQHVRKAIVDGFVYDGIYSSHRGRRFGNSSAGQPGELRIQVLPSSGRDLDQPVQQD